MPTTLYETETHHERQSKKPPKTSIVPGTVQNNCDLLAQGKVLVRLPSMNQEVWARMTASGAGKGTGLFHAPNIGDEVLVAVIHRNPMDAYILGGVWSTSVSLPIPPVPTNVPTKRVIRTGLTSEVGHEIEFDDLLQTITITSSMPPGGMQKIKMEPTAITLTNSAGSIQIGIDPSDPAVTLKIESKAGIKLKSDVSITLDAPLINIESDGPCVVSGTPVKIN
jgi:uncharacterized protein involved in type VI secretion and phage assembly